MASLFRRLSLIHFYASYIIECRKKYAQKQPQQQHVCLPKLKGISWNDV